MSTTRRTDESFADFKVRQWQESRQTKLAARTGHKLTNADEYGRLPTKQIVTRAGITAGQMRTVKYQMAANIASSLSNSEKKRLGLLAKKPAR